MLIILLYCKNKLNYKYLLYKKCHSSSGWYSSDGVKYQKIYIATRHVTRECWEQSKTPASCTTLTTERELTPTPAPRRCAWSRSWKEDEIFGVWVEWMEGVQSTTWKASLYYSLSIKLVPLSFRINFIPAQAHLYSHSRMYVRVIFHVWMWEYVHSTSYIYRYIIIWDWGYACVHLYIAVYSF